MTAMTLLLKLLKWILIIFVVFPLFLILLMVGLGKAGDDSFSGTPSATASAPSITSAGATAEAQPAPVVDRSRDRNVVLNNLDVDFTWKLGGFDTVAIATFKIKNKNEFSLKDLVVECSAFGKSGTRLGTNKKTVYEIFPAGKLATVKDFHMGFVNSQADTYGCSVIGYSEHRE